MFHFTYGYESGSCQNDLIVEARTLIRDINVNTRFARGLTSESGIECAPKELVHFDQMCLTTLVEGRLKVSFSEVLLGTFIHYLIRKQLFSSGYEPSFQV